MSHGDGRRRKVFVDVDVMQSTLFLFALLASFAQPQTTIFKGGDSKYPCVRIPSALAIPNTNVILAFAECRRWGGDQCFNKGVQNASREQEFNRSICLRRSTNGGLTFGPLSMNITRRYSANPSAAVLPKADKILLVFNDAVDKQLYSLSSNDLGRTWDPFPTPLVDNLTGTVLTGVAGPGNSVVALSDHSLLVAVYDANRQNTTMFSSVRVFKSTDNGKSWTNVSPISSPGIRMFPHLGEPSLAVLRNGVVILDSRCPDGRGFYPGPAAPCNCNCRGVSVSHDHGVTWSPTNYDNTTVMDPDCQGAVLGLSNGSFVFSNPNSATERIDLSVRLGEGVVGTTVEWSNHVTSLAGETTSAGYSSLFESDNGSVGVLWETQGQVKDCHGEGCSIVLSFL